MIRRGSMDIVRAVSDRPAALDINSIDDRPWLRDALCSQTDPEAFFPLKGGSTRVAKRICLGCPVRSECLEWALEADERFGIWGGLSERERRREKYDRLRAAEPPETTAS